MFLSPLTFNYRRDTLLRLAGADVAAAGFRPLDGRPQGATGGDHDEPGPDPAPRAPAARGIRLQLHPDCRAFDRLEDHSLRLLRQARDRCCECDGNCECECSLQHVAPSFSGARCGASPHDLTNHEPVVAAAESGMRRTILGCGGAPGAPPVRMRTASPRRWGAAGQSSGRCSTLAGCRCQWQPKTAHFGQLKTAHFGRRVPTRSVRKYTVNGRA